MRKIIIISVLLGISICLITGVLPNLGQGMGVNWWGSPLYWMSKGVLPDEYPEPELEIHYLHLILDMLFWFVFVSLISFVLFRKKMLSRVYFAIIALIILISIFTLIHPITEIVFFIIPVGIIIIIANFLNKRSSKEVK